MISLMIIVLAPLIVILIMVVVLRRTEVGSVEKIEGSLDSHLIEKEIESPYQWWAGERKRYNIGILLSSLFVCIIYYWKVQRLLEFNLYIFIFIGLMIGIANVYYFLGYIIERLAKPSAPQTFRKITFNILYWFSILVSLLPLLLFFYD